MTTATPRALLEQVAARLEREAAAIRAQLASLDDDAVPAAEPGFAEHDLIEIAVAAQRFGFPADTIRLWARTNGIGEKRGGRWLVSVRRLRARLGR